jgi:hypothetical protein
MTQKICDDLSSYKKYQNFYKLFRRAHPAFLCFYFPKGELTNNILIHLPCFLFSHDEMMRAKLVHHLNSDKPWDNLKIG